MANAADYAAWIVANKDKQGTPEFETVAQAYKVARQSAPVEKFDPTEGMSTGEKLRAGFGKSIADLAQGIGQNIGLVDRADVAESRRLNAPLMATGAGKVGDIAGNIATTLPLAFVPGANTIVGAGLIGAGTGLMQPSESTKETLMNTGGGALLGGGSIMGGRALAAGYQGLTGLLRPSTEKGRREIAAEILQRSATDANQAAKNAALSKELVPGSYPTMGQVAKDPGLAQLERTLLNNPETAGPLQQRYAQQQAARTKALSDIAGTPDYRSSMKEGRKVFANEDYTKAITEGMDYEMAKAMQPAIDSLMKRPSIQSAKMVAQKLAAENDVALNNFGSVEGMDWVVKALNNQISKANMPGSSIGKEELRALLQTKSDLMNTLEAIAPAYKTANENFAKMSKNINAMDVAADLQNRLYKNANFGSSKEMASAYKNELNNALESVKRSTGMDVPLSSVMPTKDIAVLEGIAKDLTRKEEMQNLGRAVGSPTMQNMMGQALLQRVAGPLGLPQTFSQSVLAKTIARPYDFAFQAAKPQIESVLAEALANPAKANELLKFVAAPSRIENAALAAEKFLPVPGLLSLENR